jgi:hypothetical protein
MICTEDQFRAILREEAADITAQSIPPLRRPDDEPARPARLRPAGVAGTRRRRWIVPLAAAAAVTTIAVAATDAGSGARLPEPGSAGTGFWHGVPAYFLALRTDVTGQRFAVVVVAQRTATGAVVATARPPGVLPSLVAADGASDRAFVVVSERPNGSGEFFLARLNIAARTITFRRLPITASHPTAIAVSPDGSELAVEQHLYPKPVTEIQTYSISGTILRTWRSRDTADPGNLPSFAWGPGGTLAFTYYGAPSASDGIRLLSAAARSGNLLRASRLAVPLYQPGGYSVSDFLLTGHGTTFLALLQRLPAGKGMETELAVFSARTGHELSRFWYSADGAESLEWSNPSGGPAVLWRACQQCRPGLSELGILDGSRFVPTPILFRQALYTAVAF